MVLYKSRKRGFVKAIIIIVIALIILGYFGYNIENILNSPGVQKNLNYVWSILKTVWTKYLIVPFEFVWDKIIIGLGWHNLQKLIQTYGN